MLDAWEFYSAYIHAGAKDRITFLSEEIANDFHVASQKKDMRLMQKAVEEVSGREKNNFFSLSFQVYKKLYQVLNYDYVIPFCQSESYLGYLCGAPPHVDELIRGPKDDASVQNKAKTAQTASFSISQFK